MRQVIRRIIYTLTWSSYSSQSGQQHCRLHRFAFRRKGLRAAKIMISRRRVRNRRVGPFACLPSHRGQQFCRPHLRFWLSFLGSVIRSTNLAGSMAWADGQGNQDALTGRILQESAKSGTSIKWIWGRTGPLSRSRLFSGRPLRRRGGH